MTGSREPEPRVLALVPHRAPILQLRTIVAATAESAETEGDDPGPEGLPWQLAAVEGLAQTAAVLHGTHEAPRDGAPAGMLVGLRRFVCHREPPAGAVRRFRVELARRLGPAALVSGVATADGVVFAEGELKLWNPEPEATP